MRIGRPCDDISLTYHKLSRKFLRVMVQYDGHFILDIDQAWNYSDPMRLDK